MFADLLAEVRAYGEGLVIAEQIPAKLILDVIKNTAVKVVHRLPAADDREAVGATMNLTPDQSAYLVTLVPVRPRSSPTAWTPRCSPGCPTAPAERLAPRSRPHRLSR
jgi:hypothetical protein